MNNMDAVPPGNDRRRFPRYFVSARLTLAIDDERLNESIGIGEPDDISLGGMRVRNLPASQSVKVGDQLGLLLLDTEDALSLKGEVVHRGTPGTFGLEFHELNTNDQNAVGEVITRLHSQTLK